MGTLRMVRLGIIIIVASAASISALPPSSPAPAEGAVTIAWSTTQRTLGDRRTYFVRVPTCAPARSSGCQEFLGRDRPVVLFLHAAGAEEDPEAASVVLGGLHGMSRDTIFAFAVSKDGDRRFDAGFCCTSERIDDVGYLARVVNNIAARWAVDRQRVGTMGLSNGGMLALRAICERPDLIAAAAALAGTYDRSCDTGHTRIGQWHGARDGTLPLNGGATDVGGTPHDLPPVVSLAQRMAPGSVYELRVLPNRGHSIALAHYRQATRWLLAHLPG